MDFVGCKFNLRQDHPRVGLPVVITDRSASLAAQARNDRTDRPVFSVYIAEWHTDLLGCKFTLDKTIMKAGFIPTHRAHQRLLEYEHRDTRTSWATSSTSDKNFCKPDFLSWSPIGPDPWRH